MGGEEVFFLQLNQHIDYGIGKKSGKAEKWKYHDSYISFFTFKSNTQINTESPEASIYARICSTDLQNT